MIAKPIVIALGILVSSLAWADSSKLDAPVTVTMPATEAAPMPVQKMNENLDRMRDLTGRMQQAKDPAERRQLMMDYMSAQRENMKDMMEQGMPAGGMGMMGMMGKRAAGPVTDLSMGDHCEHGDAPGHGMNDHCMQGGMNDHCVHGGKDGCKMGGHDEGLMSRLHNIEKRLDALQDMLNMMRQEMED